METTKLFTTEKYCDMLQWYMLEQFPFHTVNLNKSHTRQWAITICYQNYHNYIPYPPPTQINFDSKHILPFPSPLPVSLYLSPSLFLTFLPWGGWEGVGEGGLKLGEQTILIQFDYKILSNQLNYNITVGILYFRQSKL